LPNVTPGLTVVASGTDYRPAQLKAQVAAVLARVIREEAGGFGKSASSPAPSGARARLSACVQVLARGQTPRLVDVARYDGRPATVIVVPGARGNRLRVLVVGPGCSAAATDLLASTTIPSGG
jgi:hypothetical protein